jgi:two-component system phosphate regulon sensor histidine kinase PhoR
MINGQAPQADAIIPDETIAGARDPAAPSAVSALVERASWLIRVRWVAIAGILLTIEIVHLVLRLKLAVRPLHLILLALALHNMLLKRVLPRVQWEDGEGELPAWNRGNALAILALAPVYVLKLLLSACALPWKALARFVPRDTLRKTGADAALERLIVPLAWRGLGREQDFGRAAIVASAQIAFDLIALTALVHYTGGIGNPFVFFYVFPVIIASILLSRRTTFLVSSVAFILACAVGLGELSGLLAHYPLAPLTPPNAFSDPFLVAAQLVILGSILFLAAHLATSIVVHLRDYEREAVVLSRKLASKADELESVCSQLTRTEETKSQYMRRVAHELRSPLATIQAVLKVVLDGLVGEIPAQARDMIERAESRAGELSQATQDLLTLTRARESRIMGEKSWIDVAETASEVVTDMQNAAAQSSVILTFEQTNTVGRIVADPTAIRQLIRNLVSNAIRYNKPGGTVYVRVREIEDDMVQIEIEDTGIGIYSGDIPRIFDEFFRSTSAKKHVPTGTGLGLPIVKAVAEQHGGRVVVRSNAGEGTCFTVRLPRNPPTVRVE